MPEFPPWIKFVSRRWSHLATPPFRNYMQPKLNYTISSNSSCMVGFLNSFAEMRLFGARPVEEYNRCPRKCRANPVHDGPHISFLRTSDCPRGLSLFVHRTVKNKRGTPANTSLIFRIFPVDKNKTVLVCNIFSTHQNILKEIGDTHVLQCELKFKVMEDK